MTDRYEITEAMIAAAIDAGRAAGALSSQAKHADVRRIVSAALGRMTFGERGAPFPLWVRTGIGTKRARFIGTTERRGYYRVETETGQSLIIHSNDIEPGNQTAQSQKGRLLKF